MNKDIELLYRLSHDSEYESIICNDEKLNLLYENSTKYYKLPFSNTDCIRVMPYKNIGEFSLYLLSEFNNIALESDMLILREYLLKCINDENYCNDKVFLAFIKDFLHISRLPHFDCFVTNYYTDNNKITNLTNNEKLDIILENSKNIIFNKDYICNGLLDLIIVSLYEIFSKGLKIKKCKTCDRFFVNKHSSAFCNYANPQNETMSCLQYSRNTNYVEKRKTDPIQKIHTDISNLLRKRYYDARDSKINNKELEQSAWITYENYKEYYKQTLKPQYTRGKITRDELLKYLNDTYIYHKNNNIKMEVKKYNGSSRNNKK